MSNLILRSRVAASRRMNGTSGASWFSRRCEASSGDGAEPVIGPRYARTRWRLLTMRVYLLTPSASVGRICRRRNPPFRVTQVGGLRFANPPYPFLASLQAALMQGDDDDANDAVRYRLVLPSQPLQPPPRSRVDLGSPVAVRQALSGRRLEHARDQGAALLGDLGIRHRLNERKSSRAPAPPACCADPAKCTS